MGPYKTLALCIRNRDFEPLRPFLASDCVMTSTWFLEDMRGAESIMDYFSAKAEKQREVGSHPRVRIGMLLTHEPGTPFVAIYQGNLLPDILVLLKGQGTKITRINLCAPELFDYTFDLETIRGYQKKKEERG